MSIGPPNGPLSRILDELHARFGPTTDGQVASYIPELASADPTLFGLALTTMDGFGYASGAAATEFTIQSVSKPFVYALALADRGMDEVLSRVGVEPTGDAFNAITLEPDTGRPLNPMVNAGALLVSSLVDGATAADRFERIRGWLSAFAGRELRVDEKVFRSEQLTGDRNRAIAYLMRNAGALSGDVDEICSVYFRQCAVMVTCEDLATMAATLANGGVNPLTRRRVLSDELVGRVLTVMTTCGMYDHAGEWMLRVGVPAKSGVAGGICAVLPGQLGIGTFSPALDATGHSVRGVLACNELSTRFGLHLLRTAGLPAHPVRSTHRADAVSSKRVRSPRERRALSEHGAAIVVHELQGDLAFGSAERLSRTVLAHLDGVRWVILDLRRVGRLDESAVSLLRALLDELAQRGVTTIFADPKGLAGVGQLLRADGSTERVRDAEIALEWAEEALLSTRDMQTLSPSAQVPLGTQELLAELGAERVARLRALTETRAYDKGDIVFQEGDPADALYFVTRGLVNVDVVTSGGGRRFRLNTVPAGSAFGELALIDGGTRSSRVVVAEPTECAVLTVPAFEKLRHQDPALCDALFRAIARSLSARLRQATREIQALEA
ncbi:glutaminase A [Frankia sp. CNm7]|uniref:Glutaminase n=2 Tax=Frankia nepalensis TaxID=1836974 RepID=A0A937UP11_9ACTN|nr:glutaminase A [Frankia nepalensis]MBL7510779.1 glutaminase A [Frankia nepalensis]MBL7521555.1 glutaminase A [Frankia nepalensis]MBL7626790.1 glutaminase A [Frankia nepalensis]